MVSDEAIFTLVAAVAVTAVMMIPAIISRRGKHGEARFAKDEKRIDDE
mgnify:FL=1